MTRGKGILTVEDLEWENPPGPPGRAKDPAMVELVDSVKAMVPALRQKLEAWAVVDAYPEDEKEASKQGGRLKNHFKKSEGVERRLQFRGAKQLTGGSKLYVRLLREPKE